MNASKLPLPFLCLAALLIASNSLRAQTPEWIWHDNKGKAPDEDEVRFFRKSFTLDGTVTKAVLSVAADNEAIVYVNGRRAAQNKNWRPTLRRRSRKGRMSLLFAEETTGVPPVLF
jgi:hypothetical protein